MKLFEFDFVTEEVDIQSFFKMMREKYPHIISRKRFCAHSNEVTEDLTKDCNQYHVKIISVDT